MMAIFIPADSAACWMEFTVDGEVREEYAVGDTVSVKLTLMLTHADCLVDISETELTTNGVEILRSTKWIEVREKPVVVEKIIDVLITGAEKGDVMIRAQRICERQGGDLVIILIPEEPDRQEDGT